ncbi:MAG TPA: tRNA (adenosine(37)-N6)-threonylcarbamoyltransferase complex dimerization subunit type 1 TsaB [Gemmatimonadaceae bacterium]
MDSKRRNALAIDTTSDYLSLALLKDGRPVASHYALCGTRMARTIFTRIDELLAGAKLTPRDLHFVAAARGPGSFTGTRIGLGIALTLSQVTGIPLIGVDTLRLLAEQTSPEHVGRFIAVLNCARAELYYTPYMRRLDGRLEALGEVALGDVARLLDLAGDHPIVLRRFDPITANLEPVEVLSRVPLAREFPDGLCLLRAALPLLDQLGEATPPRVEPLYLKSEAFRTWKPQAAGGS